MNNKKFKKIIGWLHLWLGIPAGLTIFIVALTGSLLTFRDELEPILFKGDHIVEITSEKRLSVDSLLNSAQVLYPKEKPGRLVLPEKANESIEVRLGKKKNLKVVFINPYNGKILYHGSYGGRFFPTVIALHRVLLLGEAGKIITGISCAICLFLVISGIIIWWPATKKAINQRFKIKWNASGKRLTWDLHAVSGFYLSFFLLVVTLTGLVWSYDWVENALFKIADGTARKEVEVENLKKEEEVKPGIYQGMVMQMNKVYAGTGTVTLYFPAKEGQALTLQKERNADIMVVSDAAYFDSNSGALLKKMPFEQLSSGIKIRKLNLPIHSGSIFGWPTKLLALIVALFTVSLPITGVLIWWRTGKKKKKVKYGSKLVKAA